MASFVSSASTPEADVHNKPDQSIGELRVKPRQQPSILLGNFNAENPPKGFRIAIHPNPRPANSVSTSVATTGTPDSYKLILRVANNGIKTVGVTVQQI